MQMHKMLNNLTLSLAMKHLDVLSSSKDNKTFSNLNPKHVIYMGDQTKYMWIHIERYNENYE